MKLYKRWNKHGKFNIYNHSKSVSLQKYNCDVGTEINVFVHLEIVSL